MEGFEGTIRSFKEDEDREVARLPEMLLTAARRSGHSVRQGGGVGVFV